MNKKIEEFNDDLELKIQSKFYKDVISSHVFEVDSKENLRIFKCKIHRYLRKYFDNEVKIKTKFKMRNLIQEDYYSCEIDLELWYPDKADLFDLDGFRGLNCIKNRTYKFTISGYAE